MCLCDGHRTSSAVSKQQFYSLILIFGKWVKLLQRKSGEWSRCWGKIEDGVFWVFSLKQDVTAELCSFTVRTKSQFTTGWMLGGGKKASSPHLTCWFQALKMWTLPQVWLILKQKQMFALFEVHVEIGARAVYSKWEEFENSSCRGSLSNTPDHLNVRLIYCLATRSTSATGGNTIFQETWWCLIRASII